MGYGDFDVTKMDAAAEIAKQELTDALKEMSVERKAGASIVAHWFLHNFMVAGHKRLGRILVNMAKGEIK